MELDNLTLVKNKETLISNTFKGLNPNAQSWIQKGKTKTVPVQPFYQSRVNQNFKSPLQNFVKQIVYVQNSNLSRAEVKEYIESKRDFTYW